MNNENNSTFSNNSILPPFRKEGKDWAESCITKTIISNVSYRHSELDPESNLSILLGNEILNQVQNDILYF